MTEAMGRSSEQGRGGQSCKNSALGKNLFLGLRGEVRMLLGGSCPWFLVAWKSGMLPKGPALPGQSPSHHRGSPDLREQQEGAWSWFSHNLGSKRDVHPGLLPLALG